jgi:hypothetical protein
MYKDKQMQRLEREAGEWALVIEKYTAMATDYVDH